MQEMKINHINNTIVVTRSFIEAASEYGTPEYTKLDAVKKDNPNMRVVVRSTKAAGHKGENKGLTYKYMRKFISVMDSENLVTFEKIILHYESYGYESGTIYQYMKEWFLENYPEHKEMIAAAAPKRAA